jgi:hypothetical protein
MITRRLFLSAAPTALAVTGAVATPVLVEASIKASATERAERAWQDFVAAISEISPADCRIHVVGDARSFRANAMRTIMEPVHPKLPGQFMPVERFADSVGWDGVRGWYGVGRHGAAS